MKTNPPPFPAIDEALDAEEQRTAEILTELEQLNNPRCFRCSQSVCFHEYVLSVATGFKTTPHCAACLANGLGRSQAEFLTDAYNYIRRQTCYRSGWQWASRQENQNIEQPGCIWPAATPQLHTEMAVPAAGTPADPNDPNDKRLGRRRHGLRRVGFETPPASQVPAAGPSPAPHCSRLRRASRYSSLVQTHRP